MIDIYKDGISKHDYVKTLITSINVVINYHENKYTITCLKCRDNQCLSSISNSHFDMSILLYLTY